MAGWEGEGGGCGGVGGVWGGGGREEERGGERWGGSGGSDGEYGGPVCIDDMSVHTSKRLAPNYGGRVPVDTVPGPAPVCRALKTHPNSSSPRR